jgi:hypothetical protein
MKARRTRVWLAVGISLIVAVTFGGVAQAKGKAGKRATPADTLSLKARWEPTPPLYEPIPGAITEGHAFYGTLTSARSACRAGRPVIARYEFPHDSTPLIRPMWANGNGPIKTDSNGRWKADPVVFARQAYRVTAFVKARRLSARLVCPLVESKPLSIPAQYPPGE